MSLPPAVAAALDARIAPVKKPAGYRWAAAGVAVGMVLLPLLYAALVAGVGWAVWWYATHAQALFTSRVNSITILFYLGPLVIGSLLALFMVKPLFAPRRRRGRPVSLTRAEEPALFAFAEGVADAVGAPRPARIDVDCRANASASFRGGWASLFSRDLVLTVGLPLADGLSTRELAGVLAHEFGHFAQGGGMRLTYVVESISAWFERVVYERDRWDEWLERSAEEWGGWGGLVLGLSTFGVAAGRWVLGRLMTVGRWLSRGLLRQMEFDADRYEVRVAGAAAFASTMDRIVVLGAAEQATFSELDDRVRERRLPDDLPSLARAIRADIPAEAEAQIVQHARAAETGALDTHPAPSERVASAEREGGAGLDFPALPARALFADFEGLSRRTTVALYESALQDAPPHVLVPTADLLASRSAEAEAFDALSRLTLGVSYLPELREDVLEGATPGRTATPQGGADAVAALNAARQRQAAARPAAHAADERLTALYEVRLRAEQALSLARTATPFPAQEYGLERSTAEAAQERLDAAASERAGALEAAEPFAEALGARLRAAFEAGSEEQSEVLARSVRTLVHVGAQTVEIRALQADEVRAGALVHATFARRQARQADEYVAERALAAVADARRRLLGLRSRLADVPYPFDQNGDLSLGEYLVDPVPDRDDVGATLHAASEASRRLGEVRARAWAAVAACVERVEALHGLDPTTVPSDMETAEHVA